MWLVFNHGGKRYLIEFKGDETIATVCKILRERHGLPQGMILSFLSTPLTANHMKTRIQDIDGLVDMSEISVTANEQIGGFAGMRQTDKFERAPEILRVRAGPRRKMMWSSDNVQTLIDLGVSAELAKIALMMTNDNMAKAATMAFDAEDRLRQTHDIYESFTSAEKDAIERLRDTGKEIFAIIKAFAESEKNEQAARDKLA